MAAYIFAVPLAADAQHAEKVYRIGWLSATSSTATYAVPNLEVFRQALRELGYVEGRNIVIDYRFVEGRLDRLSDLAAELVRLKVDIIVAVTTPSAVVAKSATASIPIVMINVGDPVQLGLVASLAHPGGNVTGASAWIMSAKAWSSSRKPSPTSDGWRFSRTRPILVRRSP